MINHGVWNEECLKNKINGSVILRTLKSDHPYSWITYERKWKYDLSRDVPTAPLDSDVD